MAVAATRAARRGVLGCVFVAVLLLGEAMTVSAADAAPAQPAHSSVVAEKKPTPAQKRAAQKAAAKKAAAKRAQQKKVAAAKRLAAKKAAARKKAARLRQLAAQRQRNARQLALQRSRDAARAAWAARAGTRFNYPLSPRLEDRYKIRKQIRLAIQHSPSGSVIRLATFNLDDPLITRDLVAAHRRSVSVQVLVARRSALESHQYRVLVAGLKKKRYKAGRAVGPSFAKSCLRSCRGTRGLLHSKIYLFSRVGTTSSVTMLGSANLTTFAAVGQWNHLDTFTGAAEYRKFIALFRQMKKDRPARPMTIKTSKLKAWVYPRPGTTIRNDPLARDLRRIDCRYRAKGAKGVQRSQIRIGMYAWFDTRGDNLARLVRQKWEQGCSVSVIYSVTNSTVLKVLRSRSGRGPIPVSRTATLDREGEVVDYNHSKYVAVSGRFKGRPDHLVWTGSMNWTALGIGSDELVIRLHGSKVYNAYVANFRRIWRGPATHRVR